MQNKMFKIWTPEYVMSLPSVLSGRVKILSDLSSLNNIRSTKIDVMVDGKHKQLSARAIRDFNMTKRNRPIRNVKYTINEAKSIVETSGLVLLSASIENVHSKLLIKCGFGHEFEKSLSKINSGQNKCPICQKNKIANNSKNSCPYGHWNNERFDALLFQYYPKHKRISNVVNSLSKVRIECDKGHIYERSPDRFFNTSNYNNHDDLRGCPTCKMPSLFERSFESFLLKNNIAFKKQETFNNSVISVKGGIQKFDFYLVDNKLLIELDGHFHFSKETIKNKGFKIPTGSFHEFHEETKLRDENKDKYCLDKGISLIRIPYFTNDSFNKLLLLLELNYKGITCLL